MNAGIDEGQNLIHFIHPNPVQDYIEFTNDGMESTYELKSSNGKSIKSGIVSHGYNKILFEKQNTEVYFLIIAGKSYKLISIK